MAKSIESELNAIFGDTCGDYNDLTDKATLSGTITAYDAHTAFFAGASSYERGEKYPLGPSTDALWFRHRGFMAAKSMK